MDKKILISDGVAVAFTAIQTEQVFQIISLIITCLSVAVSLAFTIYKWWKEAKKDGKITVDELKQLKEDTKEDASKLVDSINDVKQSVKKEKEDK